MLKAYKEIGFKKAFKFFLSPLKLAFLKLAIYPPLRTGFLRILGAKVGKETIIHKVNFFNLYRTGFQGFLVGNRCFFGEECLFDLADKIIFEDDVTLAVRITVLTHTNVGYKEHPLQKHFPAFNKPVIFKKGCFIGSCSTILAGVTIGEGSFVAAGSVVVNDVPAHHLVAGVPAKIIRKIE